jgi:TolA-binding protein
MRIFCFTSFRLLAAGCLSLCWVVALPAQAPLLSDSIATSELSDTLVQNWRIESADRALQSGLPGLAETIYRSVLEGAEVRTPAQLSNIRLGLSLALIGQGRFEAARAQLESLPSDLRSARHALYLALAIFGEGGAGLDEAAFRAVLEDVSESELLATDVPWWAMAQGFAAELEGDAEAAAAAYTRASEAAGQTMLRSHFEGLIMRQKLLSSPADEALAAELRAKINLFEGPAAYPFVREYAVLLHSLGRIGEAVGAIERELENISAGYAADEREQLRLLKGVILGADSESGRAALKELIRSGRNREAMGIALQLLARVPGQEADLLDFLKVMISRTEPHPLLGQMYYLRSQLALRDPDMRTIAESDARILLDQFPGLSEITNVYRILAYAALEKTPPQYRAAADFLIQLRDQSTQPAELVELNRLIGDCYFLNRDFANAVDFYSAARSREIGAERSGALFLRLVLALVRSGSMDAALQLIDEADFSGRISRADRWRAEWNVAQALHTAGELDRALQRVRLLLQDASPRTVPAALDFRLLWLEAKLSLEAGATDGLAERVAQMLARLDSLPDDTEPGADALTPEIRRLLKTEFLLLQGSVLMQEGDANAGMAILMELRGSFAESAAAQRSYLIEAGYHGLVGDFVSAQGTLTNLAQSYPESPLAPQALYEAALYCERRGAEFYTEAVVLHNDLAERYRSDPLYYFARLKQGNLLRSLNEFADAQIVYENLINGFPAHEMRYVAELSRADCMLALAGNESGALTDVVAVLERLLDLPNLPLDFQAEASYKWAFALLKSDATAQAKEVLSLSVGRFLLDGAQATELGASGRYWVARSMLKLGELLEDESSLAEARRVYRRMIAYNLPGRHIAISRADRLLNVE